MRGEMGGGGEEGEGQPVAFVFEERSSTAGRRAKTSALTEAFRVFCYSTPVGRGLRIAWLHTTHVRR